MRPPAFQIVVPVLLLHEEWRPDELAGIASAQLSLYLLVELVLPHMDIVYPFILFLVVLVIDSLLEICTFSVVYDAEPLLAICTWSSATCFYH